MPNLILASGSPRRKELLSKLQIPFKSITSKVDEHFQENLSPENVVVELAHRKAREVFKDYQDAVVIGSDTVVVHKGRILGKPHNRDDARAMLQQLSGQTHSVFTGVAVLFQKQIKTFFEKTDVTFWELSSFEIEEYLNTGEPFDKAGSYGIQGFGSLFVKSIHGDYYSVVGLPISRLKRELSVMKVFN